MTLREMYRIAKDQKRPLEQRYAMVRKMVLRRKYIALRKANYGVHQIPPHDRLVLMRTKWRREHKKKGTGLR